MAQRKRKKRLWRPLTSPGWFARVGMIRGWQARRAGPTREYTMAVRGKLPSPLPRLPVLPWTREPLPEPQRQEPGPVRFTHVIVCDVCGVPVPNGRLGNLYVRCLTHATVTHALPPAKEDERPRVWYAQTREWR